MIDELVFCGNWSSIDDLKDYIFALRLIIENLNDGK
jgi:hypothetical protein